MQKAFRRLFISHPDCHPGQKLLRTGMMASANTLDGKLASQLISQEVAQFAPSPFEDVGRPAGVIVEPSLNIFDSAMESSGPEAEVTEIDEGKFSSPSSTKKNKDLASVPPVSFSVFRKALEISLNSGDMESSETVLHSFDKLSAYFPLERRTEICSLGLIGYVQDGNVDAAMNLLKNMVSQKMKPRYE